MMLYLRSLLTKEFAIGVVILIMIILVVVGWFLHRAQQRELHEQDWKKIYSSGYDRNNAIKQKGALKRA